MIQPTNAQQLYPQQGGANAVSINIYNPTAYGSTPQTAAQTAPYNYQNSLYQMPQASAYQQQAMPSAYQQYMPMQNPMTQPPIYFQPANNVGVPQQVTPQPPIYFQPAQANVNQALAAPTPQVMPESVMAQAQVAPALEQVQAQPQAQVQPEAQAVAQPQEQPQVQAQPQVQPEAQVQPQTEVAPLAQEVPSTINADALIQGLKSTDQAEKAKAIDQIAIYAQDPDPKVALQVVSEPIMNALVDVIKEDTSKLEGPTEQQIAVAEKSAKGEKLTPEEVAISEQISPRDFANTNRIYSMFTLAMIQKLQRDELNQYIETQKANGEQPIAPMPMNDLIGFNEIVNIINNDPRPELKVGAIQALQYIAEPQDKEAVKQILANSLNSTDEAVKAVANETMAKFDNTIKFEPAKEQQQTNTAA